MGITLRTTPWSGAGNPGARQAAAGGASHPARNAYTRWVLSLFASRLIPVLTALTLATQGCAPLAPPPSDPEAAVVVQRIIDGDTIEVRLGGKETRVRYIGINTPESVDPRRPVERFGKEASERNRQLVQGKTVRLERDASETDRHDRLLRYVWVDGAMVNEVLVQEGFARAVSYPPDVKYQERLRSAERDARAAKRGLWGAD